MNVDQDPQTLSMGPHSEHSVNASPTCHIEKDFQGPHTLGAAFLVHVLLSQWFQLGGLLSTMAMIPALFIHTHHVPGLCPHWLLWGLPEVTRVFLGQGQAWAVCTGPWQGGWDRSQGFLRFGDGK